jgi:hypothetical protein
MKNLITLACLFAGLNATAQMLTVSSDPLWTDTGISLGQFEAANITATGTWNTEVGAANGSSGPDGLPLTGEYNLLGWSDGFLAGANKGELLAYVGVDPYQGHWGDASFFPAATGYWAIGSEGSLTAPEAGELWLGFNDDAQSEDVSDNSGSLQVDIQIVPEPASCTLAGVGLMIMALTLKRKFSATCHK